jgi:hypothetical protein
MRYARCRARDQCASYFVDVAWKRAFDTSVSLERVIPLRVGHPPSQLAPRRSPPDGSYPTPSGGTCPAAAGTTWRCPLLRRAPEGTAAPPEVRKNTYGAAWPPAGGTGGSKEYIPEPPGQKCSGNSYPFVLALCGKCAYNLHTARREFVR